MFLLCVCADQHNLRMPPLQVGRSRTTGLNWVEDMTWTRSLDAGWNLGVVRKHARKLIDQLGSSGQLAVRGQSHVGLGWHAPGAWCWHMVIRVPRAEHFSTHFQCELRTYDVPFCSAQRGDSRHANTSRFWILALYGALIRCVQPSCNLQVLDDGSEHQHRFSFSVDLGCLDHVVRTMTVSWCHIDAPATLMPYMF
jgi:hypothetical protein